MSVLSGEEQHDRLRGSKCFEQRPLGWFATQQKRIGTKVAEYPCAELTCYKACVARSPMVHLSSCRLSAQCMRIRRMCKPRLHQEVNLTLRPQCSSFAALSSFTHSSSLF